SLWCSGKCIGKPRSREAKSSRFGIGAGNAGYDSRRLAGPYSSLQLPGSLAEPRSPARCASLGPGWTLAPRSCGRAHGKVAGREGWQRRGRGPRSPREAFGDEKQMSELD
ncbi:hypothetical protein U0070_019882, partial [Myodes glareolus]